MDQEQFEKVLSYVEAGKKEGARLECGGQRVHTLSLFLCLSRVCLLSFLSPACITPRRQVGDKGFFIAPTVFTDVRDDMTASPLSVFF